MYIVKKSKKSNLIITAGALVVVCILIVVFAPKLLKDSAATNGKSAKYEKTIFNKDKIMDVNIIMDDESWDNMLKNAKKEEYVNCDIEVNGKKYSNVAIRPKGNISLAMLADDPTEERFSFKVKFDRNDKTQTLDGLDKLVLNNLMSDTTRMKEYISFDVMNYLKVTAPLYSYAKISRNGEYWGLYLAFEGMDDSFLERNYGTKKGHLYKPEPEYDSVSLEYTQMPQFPIKGKGTDLVYVDDNEESYSAIFNHVNGKIDAEDKKELIQALKGIQEEKDIEKYLDVDQMLRYLAANVFLENDDGYFGSILHNYYLYQRKGKLAMLPWDYNLAFGGFGLTEFILHIGGYTGSMEDFNVNRGIDTVVPIGSYEKLGFVNPLMKNDKYKEKYHEYMKDLIDGYVLSGQFEKTVNQVKDLISEDVKNDPTSFYTYEEFEEGIDNLKKFVNLRGQSIDKQLKGELETETVLQQSDAKVKADDVDIYKMGFLGNGSDTEEFFKMIELLTDLNGKTEA